MTKTVSKSGSKQMHLTATKIRTAMAPQHPLVAEYLVHCLNIFDFASLQISYESG